MTDPTTGSGGMSGVAAGSGSAEIDSSGDLSVGTGDLSVDAALASLEELSELPVTSHVDVFEQVHRQLHEALSTLDEG